jgi:hypothetical protein
MSASPSGTPSNCSTNDDTPSILSSNDQTSTTSESVTATSDNSPSPATDQAIDAPTENKSANESSASEAESSKDQTQDASVSTEAGYTTQWGPWQTCWDEHYQAYYYWNSETNESTWTCPWWSETGQSSTSTTTTTTYSAQGTEEYDEDAEIYAEFMGINPKAQRAQSNVGQPEYVVEGRFNVRTGRFQANPLLDPERHTQAARMARQCQVFFDYDSFVEQRGQAAASGKRRRPLTKKQLEIVKRRRKEKKEAKKREWLLAL